MAECLWKPSHDNNRTDYDTDDDDDHQSFCASFSFTHSSSCYICNGFYGPNFEEPLCGTCHAFLFPVLEEKQTDDASDNDEDSGNDEPPYQVINGQRNERNDNGAAVTAPLVAPVAAVESDENSLLQSEAEGESSNANTPKPSKDSRLEVFAEDRPKPATPHDLRYYLNNLTEQQRAENNEHVPVATRNGEPFNICDFPVEVLLAIFIHLDDISLSMVGAVCKRWQKILEVHTPQAMWEKYTKERWPLYHQITPVPSWFSIYSSLMSSCFCRTCLIQMTLKMPVQGVNHFRATRLRGDIRTLDVDAAEGIEAVPLDNQLSHWQATIIGPVGSPYEGGKFFLHIVIPFSYPMSPPIVRFLTKIVHPNVSRHGDVGIDIIQHNWSLALTISKLLLSVQSLLTDPFTEVCMEPELGRLYDNDRPKFEALARRWTWKYAMFEVIPN